MKHNLVRKADRLGSGSAQTVFLFLFAKSAGLQIGRYKA